MFQSISPERNALISSICFVLHGLLHDFNLLDMYAFYQLFFFFYIKQMALTIPFIIND